MKFTTLAGSFLLYAVAFSAAAQAPESPPDGSPYRTEPVEPFHIIDNVYYVGPTLHNPSYLLTGAEGHMIIDTIYPESVPVILQNVEKMGFNPKDIKLILATHAHSDHLAGHSQMQEMTGGRILASEGDREVIETGGTADFREGEGWPPAEVDRLIRDGEVIRLGDIAVTAHLTPGHTKGCTSFTWKAEANMQTYDVLLMCGVRIAARPLLGHPQYPDMAKDFAMSFDKLENLPVDIYLGAHGYWFDLKNKLKRMKEGGGYRVFIDRDGYRKAINGWEQEFIDQLVKEGMELVKQR